MASHKRDIVRVPLLKGPWVTLIERVVMVWGGESVEKINKDRVAAF